MKKQSTFYSQIKIQNAISNCARFPWAKALQIDAVEAAKPYLAYSDDELWDMVFSTTLPRSWMVLSDGICPSCGESVPMYSWKIDPNTHAWKVECPHCGERFPKNDFYQYYRSGLDEAGVFRYELADASLLYNEEHPAETDPLRLFGVDDGHGYIQDGKRYLFAATYLVYGQWKKRITDAIRKLSVAYTLTGETEYAHKTAVLLDRVADFLPDFDWSTQGILYEGTSIVGGYVSYCIDSCGECRELGLAYDRIFDAIQNDNELIAFLSEKAKKAGLENSKSTFGQIQLNIEERILKDCIEHAYDKNHCNYPHSELTDILLRAVLDWPNNKQELLPMMDSIMQKSTAVDGLSGEKSVIGYSAASSGGVAELFSWFHQADNSFLDEMYCRYPKLADTFTFHIDTWCLGEFYPAVGDNGTFSQVTDQYRGLGWCHSEDFRRSWLWKLYKLTGDIRFVQAQYCSIPQPKEAFSPCSVYDADAESAGREFHALIAKHGSTIAQKSVNKTHWHLALLRSGQKNNERAAWMSYDSGGAHGHCNAMNLGLFAKGLDLISDLGYPPVQFGGGWDSPHVRWYVSTAAHNTVVVDGKNQPRNWDFVVKDCARTTLWADGTAFRAMRFSGANLIENGKQYERGIYMVDISDSDFYLLDIFRVIGGKEHLKFQHTTCGEATAEGICLEATQLNDFNGFMKNYRGDQNPNPGWSVDWKIRDVSHAPEHDTNVHIRYTDLTESAEGYLADGWHAFDYNSGRQGYLTRAVTRRSNNGDPLVSNFIGIVEPYEGERTLKEMKRLELLYEDESNASPQDCAIEVQRTDGYTDLFLSSDREDPLGLKKAHANSALIQPDWDVRFRGDFCRIEKGPNGINRIALCNAQELMVDKIHISLPAPIEFAEISVENGSFILLSGSLS
jgi:hypothetical protein